MLEEVMIQQGEEIEQEVEMKLEELLQVKLNFAGKAEDLEEERMAE